MAYLSVRPWPAKRRGNRSARPSMADSEGATATRPIAPASVSFTAKWLTTKKPTVQNAATRTTQRGRRPERLQTRCAMRVGGPVDERNMLQR